MHSLAVRFGSHVRPLAIIGCGIWTWIAAVCLVVRLAYYDYKVLTDPPIDLPTTVSDLGYLYAMYIPRLTSESCPKTWWTRG